VAGCVSDTGSDSPGAAPADEVRPADPPPKPPVEIRKDRELLGTVTAVTKDSITIEPPPGNSARSISRRVEGRSQFFGYVRTPPPPRELPRTFRASETLASGGYREPDNQPVTDTYTYRLRDVKVGDGVMIYYDRVEGGDVCTAICIWARPGGLVPPAPGEDPAKPNRWHDSANESQANREKGLSPSGRPLQAPIPICKGLQLERLGGSGQWLLRFDSDGPWYVRIMIPPEGCFWPGEQVP
jgi:hypothetical protein